MSGDDRSLGAANTTIRLAAHGGQPENYVLKPSIHAFRHLSRKHGGLNELVRKVGALDIDAIVDVIEAGASLPQSPRVRDELSTKIFDTGITDDLGRVPEMCINYVISLMRGGRPAPRLTNGDGSSDEDPPQAP